MNANGHLVNSLFLYFHRAFHMYLLFSTWYTNIQIQVYTLVIGAIIIIYSNYNLLEITTDCDVKAFPQ